MGGKFRFTIALLLLSSLTAVAGQRNAVSITSAICGTSKAFTTSGVPVLYHGAPHVLTSSWGILEEPAGVCHSVFDPESGQSYPATLETIEWTLGFALLSVPGLPAETKLDAESSDPPGTSEAQIVAVASDGKTLLSKTGHYVSIKSDRHFLIDSPYAYEFASDNLDKHFVGAPVFGSSLEAIVSSEWIETIAGKRGRVWEWANDSDDQHNHLVLVPLKTISEALKKGLPPHRFFQPAKSKLGTRSLVQSGALQWELSCPDTAGKPPPDGIGPIGGGDGVGIGGEDEGVQGCTLVVTHIDSGLATPTFGPAGFFTKLEKDTQEKGPLRLPFFYRSVENGFPVRRFFLSWQDFFDELNRGGKGSPVLFWINRPEPSSDSLYDQLLRANRELQKILEATFAAISEDPSDRHDYRMLYTESAVLDSLQWRLLSWFDMQQFTGIPHGSLGLGLSWEGRPLLDVLKEKTSAIEKIRTQLGYDP